MYDITSDSRSGKELSEHERYVIEVELADGATVSSIARRLKRHRRTIEREVKRGSVMQMVNYVLKMVYRADHAQMQHRRSVSRRGSKLKIGNDHRFAQILEGLIKDNSWSPGAALGYMRRKGLCEEPPCLRTIYSYIASGVFSITYDDLPRRGCQKKRKVEAYRNSHKNIRGTSIEERPGEVRTRETFGHWEGDLVVGPSGTKTALFTLVERQTRFLVTLKLPNRKGASVKAALDRLEGSFKTSFYSIFKSITFDNGSEFSDFDGIECSRWKSRAKRTRTYFAHPYCSGERGTNENTNGMIRRKLPKGRNLGLLSDSDVSVIEDWVNDYPRGIHGYLSAREMFVNQISKADLYLPSRYACSGA